MEEVSDSVLRDALSRANRSLLYLVLCFLVLLFFGLVLPNGNEKKITVSRDHAEIIQRVVDRSREVAPHLIKFSGLSRIEVEYISYLKEVCVAQGSLDTEFLPEFSNLERFCEYLVSISDNISVSARNQNDLVPIGEIIRYSEMFSSFHELKENVGLAIYLGESVKYSNRLDVSLTQGKARNVNPLQFLLPLTYSDLETANFLSLTEINSMKEVKLESWGLSMEDLHSMSINSLESLADQYRETVESTVTQIATLEQKLPIFGISVDQGEIDSMMVFGMTIFTMMLCHYLYFAKSLLVDLDKNKRMSNLDLPCYLISSIPIAYSAVMGIRGDKIYISSIPTLLIALFSLLIPFITPWILFKNFEHGRGSVDVLFIVSIINLILSLIWISLIMKVGKMLYKYEN